MKDTITHMPSNMLYKYWPARLEGKIKGLNKKIVWASTAQMSLQPLWLEMVSKETMKKVAPKFTGKAQTVQFVYFLQ